MEIRPINTFSYPCVDDQSLEVIEYHLEQVDHCREILLAEVPPPQVRQAIVARLKAYEGIALKVSITEICTSSTLDHRIGYQVKLENQGQTLMGDLEFQTLTFTASGKLLDHYEYYA